jgi:hypothetical protein
MTNCIQCNVEFKQWRSDAKYCSNNCQQEFQYYEYICAWKQGFVDGLIGDKARGEIANPLRRYLKEKFLQCSSCGISEWNNRPITLEIEHIDGNWSNNKEDNLTLICPNCHSQTDTYRAKNKGKGRKRYGDMIAPSNIRSHSSVG